MSLKAQLTHVQSMIGYLEAREAELLSWGAKEIPHDMKDTPVSNKRKPENNSNIESTHNANRKKAKHADEPVVEKLDNRVLVQGLNYEANYNDVKDFFQSVGAPVKIEFLKRIDGQLSGCAVATFESKATAIAAEQLILTLLRTVGPTGPQINGKRVNVFAEATINGYVFPQLLISGCGENLTTDYVKQLLLDNKIQVKSIRQVKEKDNGKFNGLMYVDVHVMNFNGLVKLKKAIDGTYVEGKSLEVSVPRQKNFALDKRDQLQPRASPTSVTKPHVFTKNRPNQNRNNSNFSPNAGSFVNRFKGPL